MIYDEGFEMRFLKDHRFFTFSNYYFDKKNAKNKNTYKSNCAKTLVGWYHLDNTDLYACF